MVLNASRRRCCLHITAITSFFVQPPCSTPHGVVAVCTTRLREEFPAVYVLNASRRRCCLHSSRSWLTYPMRVSAQRLTASLLSARPPGASRTRRCRVLNASRRRCCLHPAPGTRTGRSRVVLNASRRRCCLHGRVSGPRPAGEPCSTPHGVVAVCTKFPGTRSTTPSVCGSCSRVLNASRRRCCLHAPCPAIALGREGAQRLTASLLSARLHRPDGPILLLGTGVLNASRRRCCLHPAADGVYTHDLGCSTPHGVVAVCTLEFHPKRPRSPRCSTPHGVVAVCTRGRVAGAFALPVCSTPHGVVAVCTLRLPVTVALPEACSTPHGVVAVCTVPDRIVVPFFFSAQRLTASLLSAHPRTPGNYFGRKGAQRLTASLLSAHAARPSPRPSGRCAQRLTASLLSAPGGSTCPVPPDTVLNASRRRCCLHGRAVLLQAVGGVVLNASRRRCCLHGEPLDRLDVVGGVLNASRRRCCLHRQPEGGPGRGRGVLNASRRRCCLHRHRSQKRMMPLRASAQRLTASLLSAHRPFNHD